MLLLADGEDDCLLIVEDQEVKRSEIGTREAMSDEQAVRDYSSKCEQAIKSGVE